MHSRKEERKPRKSLKIKKQKKERAREEIRPKRKAIKKDKLKPIRKAQEANQNKIEESKKLSRTIELAACGLEQLKAHINIVLDVKEKAEKPIDFVRAWNALQMPNCIYCKEKSSFRDLVYCEYICDGKCSNFHTRRYLCSLMRCSEERRLKCEGKEGSCHAFKLVEHFVHKYTTAYANVHRLNKEIDAFEEERKEKANQEKIKNDKTLKPKRIPKNKKLRRAMKNASSK